MKKIDFSIDKIPEIKDSIATLGKGEYAVFIKNGFPAYDHHQWKNLLQDCNLSLDRRQYNINEKLELTEWWEISYQPEKASTYAHSNTRQPLHSDNAWFSDPAEINFFIMKKQAKSGGEQSIYPLERLIEDLSNDDPSLLHDLCNVNVIIKKGDGEYFNNTPIIIPEGDIKIFWNYYRTEKTTPQIQNMCEAFFKYLQKKENSTSIQYIRCETGDCFCFHDLKILHGRTAFEATLPYDRILWQSMWKKD